MDLAPAFAAALVVLAEAALANVGTTFCRRISQFLNHGRRRHARRRGLRDTHAEFCVTNADRVVFDVRRGTLSVYVHTNAVDLSHREAAQDV